MKQYSLFAVLSVTMIIFVMAFVKKENERPDKHLEIVLRNIGHQVLLHSNDSTSRVLPVETIDKNTFRISFEKGFGFIPDTLMRLVHQQLAKTDRLNNYTVSVNACDQNRTIFAYEVNTTNGDLKPCRGRQQQTGCYFIDISFPATRSFNYSWLLLTLIPVAFAGLYFTRRRNSISAPRQLIDEKVNESMPGKVSPLLVDADYKTIGNFVFAGSTGMLHLNGETIELSVKEAKALSLLTSHQNQVVARELLMKEIWEDDGVVVITRNVDVLISKLRKKLSADPSVKIVNVHGKGYKLNA